MADSVKFFKQGLYSIIRKMTVPILLRLYGKNHGIDHYRYVVFEQCYRELVQCLFFQKILRINIHVPWPVHFSSMILNPENIQFDRQYVRNFMAANCYWQAGKPLIFKGSFLVAQGCAFIGRNHDVYNIALHTEEKNPIIIGDNCLFSFNSVILPGVEIGDNTTVAANAVVNKSFTEGNCIIAGTPAKIVKRLDKEKIKKCTAKDFWG